MANIGERFIASTVPEPPLPPQARRIRVLARRIRVLACRIRVLARRIRVLARRIRGRA